MRYLNLKTDNFKHMKLKLLIVLLGTSLVVSAQQKMPVYLDVTKPIEERVEDALSRMTTEEKVALCHAQSKFSSKGIARLGIPEVWTADGPHGIREEVFWDEWGGAGWAPRGAGGGFGLCPLRVATRAPGAAIGPTSVAVAIV